MRASRWCSRSLRSRSRSRSPLGSLSDSTCAHRNRLKRGKSRLALRGKAPHVPLSSEVLTDAGALWAWDAGSSAEHPVGFGHPLELARVGSTAHGGWTRPHAPSATLAAKMPPKQVHCRAARDAFRIRVAVLV